MFLNKDDVTITSFSSTWQMCNAEVLYVNEVFEHDITMKSVGWTFDPVNGQIDDTGMGQFQYYHVKVKKVEAQASNGEKFEFKDPTEVDCYRICAWT